MLMHKALCIVMCRNKGNSRSRVHLWLRPHSCGFTNRLAAAAGILAPSSSQTHTPSLLAYMSTVYTSQLHFTCFTCHCWRNAMKPNYGNIWKSYNDCGALRIFDLISAVSVHVNDVSLSATQWVLSLSRVWTVHSWDGFTSFHYTTRIRSFTKV